MIRKCFIIIFLNFLMLWKQSATLTLNKDKYYMERRFVKKFIESLNKPVNLCDLPDEQKLAICDAVIKSLRNEIKIHEYQMESELYINKAAFHYLSPRCAKMKLTFSESWNIADENAEQDMFPCFGRHNPTRTNWHVDDNYNVVYVSGGPNFNSAYVFVRVQLTRHYVIEFYRLITNFDIAKVKHFEITAGEVEYEQSTLGVVSYNGLIHEIEINYVRETVLVDIDRDPICNLDRENKILLCKRLLEGVIYRGTPNARPYAFSVSEFENRSTECVENRLLFRGSTTTYYNYQDTKRRMYPCYGAGDASASIEPGDTHVATFYLSVGYRRNSALVYTFNRAQNVHEIIGFIENLPADYNEDGKAELIRLEKGKNIVSEVETTRAGNSKLERFDDEGKQSIRYYVIIWYPAGFFENEAEVEFTMTLEARQN